MKKHVAIIALVLQNLRLLCLSFLTISKTSFSINNERFRIEEIYAESKEINQDYFRFQGKRSALVQSLPNPIPGERIQARDGTYSFTILTDGLKEDTILSEGRYPENDNEIMVSRIFESTINRRFIDCAIWPYFTAILIFGGHILPLGGNPPIKFIQYDIR